MIKFIRSNQHFKYMKNSCIIIYLYIYGLITDSHNDQLLVGPIAQLVERCTGTADVRVRVPVQAFLAVAEASLKCDD